MLYAIIVRRYLSFCCFFFLFLRRICRWWNRDPFSDWVSLSFHKGNHLRTTSRWDNSPAFCWRDGDTPSHWMNFINSVAASCWRKCLYYLDQILMWALLLWFSRRSCFYVTHPPKKNNTNENFFNVSIKNVFWRDIVFFHCKKCVVNWFYQQFFISWKVVFLKEIWIWCFIELVFFLCTICVIHIYRSLFLFFIIPCNNQNVSLPPK